MRVHIDVITAKRDDGTFAELYAYPFEDSGDEGVKNARHAVEIVENLTVPDGEEGIKNGVPPIGGDYSPVLFRIDIGIVSTHKRICAYTADYRRYDGCPNLLAEMAMGIYRQIKTNLRHARRDYLAGKDSTK